MTQRNGTQNEKKTFTLSLKARQMKKYPPTCTFTIIHLYSEHLCHSNKQLQNQVVANLEKPNFLIVMLVWKIDKCSS